MGICLSSFLPLLGGLLQQFSTLEGKEQERRGKEGEEVQYMQLHFIFFTLPLCIHVILIIFSLPHRYCILLSALHGNSNTGSLCHPTLSHSLIKQLVQKPVRSANAALVKEKLKIHDYLISLQILLPNWCLAMLFARRINPTVHSSKDCNIKHVTENTLEFSVVHFCCDGL